jgi:hypothetical protein
MLLSIDEARIRESLKNAGQPSYVATASNLIVPKVPDAPVPSLSVGGTTMFGVPQPEVAREYLLSLRREIEKSRVPLKTVGELDAEIDQMRGRGR